MKVWICIDRLGTILGIFDSREAAYAQRTVSSQTRDYPIYVEQYTLQSSPSPSSSQQSCQTEQSSYSQCSSGIPGDMWE